MKNLFSVEISEHEFLALVCVVDIWIYRHMDIWKNGYMEYMDMIYRSRYRYRYIYIYTRRYLDLKIDINMKIHEDLDIIWI